MLIGYLLIIGLLYLWQAILVKNMFVEKVAIPIVVSIFLIIVLGGSTSNPDYEVYMNMYARGDQYKALGFQALIQVSKSMGLDYPSFRMLIGVIGYALLYLSISSLTKNTHVFYALYIIYPFCYDAVQLRNFLAMALFVFAFSLLANVRNKNVGMVLYVLVVLVAASMQVVAFVYLPICLLSYIKDSKIYRYCIYFAVFASIIFGLNKNAIAPIVSTYGSFILNNDTGGSNYLQVNTRFGWIINWFQQFANYFLVFYCSKYCHSHFGVIDKAKKKKYTYVIDVIENINLYMFLFLPLFVLDENYTRIIRNVMLLNFIVYLYYFEISHNVYMCRRIKYQNRLLNLNLFSLHMPIVAYQIILLSLMLNKNTESIFIPLLTQNIFIG